MVNVKTSIRDDVFDSWLSDGGNGALKNNAYWTSDEGMKQTKECKELLEMEENINAYEMCGDPAESTNEDLLTWAGDMNNQHKRRLLVESIASLPDDVLLQSYVDGQFLIDLKKGHTFFNFQAHVFV